MKKSVLKVFSAVILLVGIIVVSGCNEETPAITPQDIDIVDTTKAVLFKEVLPISADTVIIVNSDDDLKSYCDKTPSFDFIKGSLLFTSGHTASSIFKISVKLTKQDNTNYKCLVDVQEDYTAKPDSWKRCYWVSQKIDPKAKITISINKHH
jgi:hypothetical protein